MTTKQSKLESQQAQEKLREMLKPGSEVSCILRHVSTSGMTRHISLVITNPIDNEIENITWFAAKALGEKITEKNGAKTIKVTGCGMDMGFNLVYNLSRCLFPKGFTPADAGKTSGRNGTLAAEIDTDGGYALKHRWL